MTVRQWCRAGLAAVACCAGAAQAKDGVTPLFASEAPLQLTLSGKFPGPDNHSTTPLPATLAVTGGAAAETLPITLTARGITRRAGDICSFPPLRLTFADKPPAGSLFAKQKRLKLTTHCRSAADFNQYQLIELAAYRMYNLMTPVSYRTRLVQIDYRDARGKPMLTRYGFLLEDADDVAARNGLTEVKLGTRVPVSAISSPDAARFALFEYMIGNLDWAMNAGPPGAACCHNAKLLAPPASATGLVPLPYDFDFSGLVDAPYATPPANIPMPNVRVRRYRGYCRDNAAALALAADLSGRAGAFRAVLTDLPQLNSAMRQKALAYLDGFFAAIATPASVNSKLLTTCQS